MRCKDMPQNSSLLPVFTVCLYVASFVGAILVFAGIYAIYNSAAPIGAEIKIRGIGELHASEGIFMVIAGGFLIALGWLPNILHRPAAPAASTQTVRGEIYEGPKPAPGLTNAIPKPAPLSPL